MSSFATEDYFSWKFHTKVELKDLKFLWDYGLVQTFFFTWKKNYKRKYKTDFSRKSFLNFTIISVSSQREIFYWLFWNVFKYATFVNNSETQPQKRVTGLIFAWHLHLWRTRRNFEEMAVKPTLPFRSANSRRIFLPFLV